MPTLPSWLSSPLLEPLSIGPQHLKDVALAEIFPELLSSTAASLQLDGLNLTLVDPSTLVLLGQFQPASWFPALPLAGPWQISGSLTEVNGEPTFSVNAAGETSLTVGPLQLSGLVLNLTGTLNQPIVEFQAILQTAGQAVQVTMLVADLSQPARFELKGDPGAFVADLLRDILGSLAPPETSLPTIVRMNATIGGDHSLCVDLELEESQELPEIIASMLGQFRADIPNLPLARLKALWQVEQRKAWVEGVLDGRWDIAIHHQTLQVEGPSFRIDASGLTLNGGFVFQHLHGQIHSIWGDPIRIKASLTDIILGEAVSSLLPHLPLPERLKQVELGSLDLEVLPDTGGFVLEARGSPLRLHLPIAELDVIPYLSFSMDHVVIAGGSEQSEHRLEVQGSAQIENLPAALQGKLHPQITGALRVDQHGAHLALPMVIAPLDIPLGALGTGHVEISDVDLLLGSDVHLTAEMGFGIPDAANLHFAHLSTNLFNTWQPGHPDSQVRMRLAVSPLGEITLQLCSSPFQAMQCTVVGEEVRAVVDLGELGTLRMVLPTFSYKKGKISAKGAFDSNGFTPTLANMRRLLKAIGLGPMAEAIPDPDEHSQKFVKELLSKPSLPDSLASWHRPKIPDALAYNVGVAVDGTMEMDLETRGAPLMALLPSVGPTGPTVVGLAVSRVALGTSWTATFSRFRLNARAESFDLLPLLGQYVGIPTNQLWRRLVIDDLWVVMINHGGIHVVAPLFFKELGLSWRGMQGAEFEAHASLPIPSVTGEDLLKLLGEASTFLRTPDGRLDEDHPPHNLDLRLTIGPTYLKLPTFLGGETFGAPQGLQPISAWAKIAHALNGFKAFDLEEALLAVDRTRRSGQTSFQFGPLHLSGWWLMTSAEELRRGAWHTVDVPEEQVAAVAGLLGDKGDRLATVVTGGWTVAEICQLHATLGMVLTEQGFRGSICFSGALADGILRLAAGGQVMWNPEDPIVDLQVQLQVSELSAFNGTLELGEDQFVIRGALDLWPSHDVGLTGSMEGTLSSNGLLVRGAVAAHWGDWRMFPEAKFVFSDEMVQLQASFLGETVVMTSSPAANTIRFAGPFEKTIELPGFKIWPGEVHLMPEPGGVSPLGFTTTVEQWGCKSTTVIRFGPKGFEFDAAGLLWQKYSSEFTVRGGDLLHLASVEIEGVLHTSSENPLPIQRWLHTETMKVAITMAELASMPLDAAANAATNFGKMFGGFLGKELKNAGADLARLSRLGSWDKQHPGQDPIFIEDIRFRGGLDGNVRLKLKIRFLDQILEDQPLDVHWANPESWGQKLAEHLLKP